MRQAWLRKSEYLCQIGDKEAASKAFESTFEKTVGLGYRIDLVFNLIRLGFFFLDHKLISTNIAKAKDLMEQVCICRLYKSRMFYSFLTRVVTGIERIVSVVMKVFIKWLSVI